LILNDELTTHLILLVWIKLEEWSQTVVQLWKSLAH